MSDYGKRGGSGPTRGQQATTYLVPLPDGTTAQKRSFKVHTDIAWAGIYEHLGRWFVSGVRETRAEIEAWGFRNPPVEVRRVQP